VSSPEGRRRGDVLGVGAIASFVLSGLAIEYLAKSIDEGAGWIRVVGFLVTATLALSWLVVNAPTWWRRFWHWYRTRLDGAVPPAVTPLQATLQLYAEEAEHRLVAFGSYAGGMAAADWFKENEEVLWSLLFNADLGPESVEELARICDALDAVYVRQRCPEKLLAMSDQLATIGNRAGRRDLEELAEVRAATAHRLNGDLDVATARLGVASEVAPRNRVAAALLARRQLERGLLQLARADLCLLPTDCEDAVRNARDRFDDAALAVPHADLAADIAIHLNLGIVYLYQQDAGKALDHLRVAGARASATGDASARAQAWELTGVAAWLQDNRGEAVGWWQKAERLYVRVDESEGRARCLQHLGAAQLTSGHAAPALRLLQDSARLRGGTQGHEVLAGYLDQVHTLLGRGAEPTVEHADRPRRIGIIERLRRLWRPR